MKLCKSEKNALAFCENLKRFGGSVDIDWVKSNSYGNNPVIRYHGEKCCQVSGCGYDKESTALANVLRFLFVIDSEEYFKVWNTGGAGVNSVISQLLKYGYELRCVARGKTWDSYVLVNLNEGGE